MKNFKFKYLVAIWLVCAVCQIAQAADIPRASERDSRIQYIKYRPNDVVLLNIVVGTGSRIVFSKEESIINIASGFSSGWQLEPVENELFISAKSIQLDGTSTQAPFTRPIPGEWDTNVMVTTTRGLYDFDLRLLSKDGRRDGKRAFYRVEFEYADSGENTTVIPSSSFPSAPQKPRELSFDRSSNGSINHEAVTPAIDTDKRLPPRNDMYSMTIGESSSHITPTIAYDDGLFTYLRFPNNTDIPAAYLVRENGESETEVLIDGHIDTDRPEYIVLHRVARKFRLRLENAVIDVYNDNFQPSGLSVSNGTTVPGTKRVFK